jgi:hypothetical protein
MPTPGFHQFADNQSLPAILAVVTGIANAAGNGNGVAVSTNVQFVDAFGSGRLPQSLVYGVHCTPSQACLTPVISNKSTTGFTVTLSPPSGVTLSAGTFDVIVAA